jgi:hypothetical protein
VLQLVIPSLAVNHYVSHFVSFTDRTGAWHQCWMCQTNMQIRVDICKVIKCIYLLLSDTGITAGRWIYLQL